MDSYDNWREMENYTKELKQLLAGSDLTPDTRARCLAALIEADALSHAAHQIHSAAQITMGDTVPLLVSAFKSFGDNARELSLALQQMPRR